jgi:hypothetical protein
VPVNVTSTVCFLVAALHEKLRGEVKDISCETIPYVGVYVKVEPVHTKVLKSVATALEVPVFKTQS